MARAAKMIRLLVSLTGSLTDQAERHHTAIALTLLGIGVGLSDEGSCSSTHQPETWAANLPPGEAGRWRDVT